MINENNNTTENTNETNEYETIMIPVKDGKESEFAILESFTFEDDNYVVVAQVIDDTISDDGLYIYQARGEGKEIEVSMLDEETYNKVAEYYVNL